MPSLVPSIPIMLDKERHLRLDNRALFDAEVELSKLWKKKLSILQVLVDVETLGMNDVSILLWCGLRHEDASLTLVQVQDAMTVQAFAGHLESIYSAWNAATAPAEEAHGEETDSPFPSASPGTDTGASLASSLA